MEQFTIQDAVEFAIIAEQTGAKLYDRLANRFKDNKELVDIFNQLALDERTHEAQFKRLLNTLPDEQRSGGGRYGVGEYLKATAISEFFRKDAFTHLSNVRTPKDALENAFKLEKNTVLFYEALRDVTGPNRALEEIIDTEKSHVVSLMKAMVSGAKFRGLDDTGP